MNINIYTGNHPGTLMVDDAINFLRKMFSKKGCDCVVSNELKTDSINLIIDEFSSLERSQKIVKFKEKHSESLIILVGTEFIERRFFVRRFNFFEGGILDAAVVSALKVFYCLNSNYFTNNLIMSDLMIGILYSPLLIFDFIASLIKKIRNRSKDLLDRPRKHAYWVRRYLGCMKMINYVDGIVVTHSKIINTIEELDNKLPLIGTIYPEIDIENISENLFKNKELFIEVTGTVTPYRLKKITEIDNDISELSLENKFKFCKAFPASNQKENSIRGAYSLHPPQTNNWKYSSPVRIYRALCFDYNIPILTRRFNDHPIEDICFIYDNSNILFELNKYFYDRRSLLAVIEPRINAYTQKSINNNNIIINKLRNML